MNTLHTQLQHINISSNIPRTEKIQQYQELLFLAKKESCLLPVVAYLGRKDLFFLLTHILHRKDIQENSWLYARCCEIQNAPNGYLDLWAREHYKSTIITFGKTIQDILINPEVTVGIFSHTRPMAKDFLNQIKYEFESNAFLIQLYPEILWTKPKVEAPIWSLDKGIVVKRKYNPKEATVEAYGLTDGQPTGKHFSILLYDDIVTRESVSSPEMIHKVTDCWALSLNLGTRTGIQRYIGTRYHHNDTWEHILERKSAIPRIYPATEDGTVEGVPVLLSKKELEDKYRAMGAYIFGCQMLQAPTVDSIQSFKKEWLLYYSTITEEQISSMNCYILVDPAGEKKHNSDYSVFIVICVGADGNYYIIDAVRDRLSLTQKAQTLFRLHKQWKPLIVGYEKYGMQADIEYMYTEQERLNYRFPIISLGGILSKKQRISRLLPLFESGKIYLPHTLLYTTCTNETKDFVQEFIKEEYLAFPVSKHDDMLDCLARITDTALEVEIPNSSFFDKGQDSIIEYSIFGE